MASFVAYVGPYLKARGYYVAVNAKNFIGGDIRANDGTLDVIWWQRLAPERQRPALGVLAAEPEQRRRDIQRLRLRLDRLVVEVAAADHDRPGRRRRLLRPRLRLRHPTPA